MIARRLTLLLAAPLVLAGCAATSTDGEVYEEPLVFKPAAALIGTTEYPDTPADFWGMMRDSLYAMRGNGAYSEQVREPMGGSVPHPVDCKATDSFAVVFIAGRPASQNSVSRFKLRYDWTYEGNGNQKNVTRFHTGQDRLSLVDVDTGERQRFWLASMKFSDKRRVEGVWSLDISYRGQKVHTEKFEVSNCS